MTTIGDTNKPPENASGRDLSDWKGCPPPERVTLEGSFVTIVPLSAAGHTKPLYDLIKNPDEHFMWHYMPYGPFETFRDFEAQMKVWEEATDPLYFTILRKEDQAPVGAYSLMRINPKQGVIEIGGIWFTGELRKTVAATEALFLLADYALTTLKYRRYEWKCHNENENSKRAATRLGFTFEGIFRQDMVLRGKNRDTAWFSILDHEWPALRDAYLHWLSPDNFDGDGRQKASLSDLTSKPKP